MPRPLPGGRSTWVGNTSRSGELKVPTYAMSGLAAFDVCVLGKAVNRSDIPASMTEVFTNERRGQSNGLIVKKVGLKVMIRVADGMNC
jgi:hypothetical protein